MDLSAKYPQVWEILDDISRGLTKCMCIEVDYGSGYRTKNVDL